MPPLYLVALAAIGTVAIARTITAQSRRINARMDRHRAAEDHTLTAVRLKRDPVTGEYRPASR